MNDEQCLKQLEEWAHTDMGPDKGVMMAARFVVAAYKRLTSERDAAIEALRPFAGCLMARDPNEPIDPECCRYCKARALVAKYGG